MAYEILVISDFGEVVVSARQPTAAQEVRLQEVEEAAIRAYEQGSREGIRRISPQEGVVDVTTLAMAEQGLRAGVMAHEDTTGTVTITRRRNRLVQAVIGALGLNQDGADTPQVENHILAEAPVGSRRVLLGPQYGEYVIAPTRQAARVGTNLHVQTIVVRRNIGSGGDTARPLVPMASTPVGSR